MTAEVVKKTISIPYRIQRSPTDLLKALSQTVKPSLTEPNYALIDDTRLLPSHRKESKKLFLSKASGVKAARLMIQTYPEAFMKKECEPHISKFFPDKIFTEEELKYPSESLLFSLLSWGKFKQAFGVYLQCKENEIHVSDACKLALFDCLCLYNSQDLPENTPLYEIWINKSAKINDSRDVIVSDWNGAEAEQMFNEIGEKTAQVYCSLIKGLIKYNAFEKASSYYEEMINKKLKPDLNTVNGIIRMLSYVTDIKYDIKRDLMMKYLKQLNEFGIKPNVHTFNSCLILVKSFHVNHRNLPLALDILKEMELLNIEPCLATWSHIISIFYPAKELGIKTQVLQQVIDQVEKKSKEQNGLEWVDVDDSDFFVVAIRKAKAIENIALIYKIHDLLMSNNNFKFLNGSAHLEIFYEEFMLSIIQLEISEKVIANWRKYTNRFTITVPILREMTKFVLQNKHYEILSELWQSYLEQTGLNREAIETGNKSFLDFMLSYNGNDENLLKEFGKIAISMLKSFRFKNENLEEKELRVKEFKVKDLRVYRWTGLMVSNVFKILLNANLVESCWDEFINYTKSERDTYGELKSDCLMDLLNALIQSNMFDEAFELLDYVVASNTTDANNFLKAIATHQNMLNDEQRAYLKQLEQKLE